MSSLRTCSSSNCYSSTSRPSIGRIRALRWPEETAKVSVWIRKREEFVLSRFSFAETDRCRSFHRPQRLLLRLSQLRDESELCQFALKVLDEFLFVFEEIECFDLTLIHDTRTGRCVELPPVNFQLSFVDVVNSLFFGSKGAAKSEGIKIGFGDVALTSLWMTVVYGSSFVANRHLRFVHFSLKSQAAAQVDFSSNFFSTNRTFFRCLSALEQNFVRNGSQRSTAQFIELDESRETSLEASARIGWRPDEPKPNNDR